MGYDFWVEAQKPKNVAARARLSALGEAKNELMARKTAILCINGKINKGVIIGLEWAIHILQEMYDKTEKPSL